MNHIFIFVAKFIFIALLAMLMSCTGVSSISVEKILENKSRFYEEAFSVKGEIRALQNVVSICSDEKNNMCISIEAKKNIYDELRIITGKKVKLYGKYLDHEFSNDGNSFVPSRFHVLKIIQIY